MEQEKKDGESTTFHCLCFLFWMWIDFVLKLSKTFNQRAPYWIENKNLIDYPDWLSVSLNCILKYKKTKFQVHGSINIFLNSTNSYIPIGPSSGSLQIKKIELPVNMCLFLLFYAQNVLYSI